MHNINLLQYEEKTLEKRIKTMSIFFLPNRVLIDGRLGFVLFFFNSADKTTHSNYLQR
jgi:hypothetical protein